MKAKIFNKKLTINKSTIANLTDSIQDQVRAVGGKATNATICTCPYTQCPFTDCGDSIHNLCIC